MYINRLFIEVKSSFDINEIYLDHFTVLLNSYRSNGQVLLKYEPVYITGNTIYSIVYTLEKESLAPINNSRNVNLAIHKIQNDSNSTLHYETLGTTSKPNVDICLCAKSKCYILTTNHLSYESPLICGSCNHSIALYKLPKYDDAYAFGEIIKWQENYKSCDILQSNLLGERWALNQLQKNESKLSKKGMSICKRVEEVTSIPTYYFILNYDKYKEENTNIARCPNCNSFWGLKEPLLKKYDFKCDNCRIVSTIWGNLV